MGQKTSPVRLLMLIAIVGGFAFGIYQSLSGDFTTLIYVAIATVALFILLLIKNLVFGNRNDNVNFKPMFKVPHDEPKFTKRPVTKGQSTKPQPSKAPEEDVSEESEIKTQTTENTSS